MDENEPEEDPFSSLTAMCHITASQQDLLRSAALARQHERFPTDHSQEASDYSVPVETVGIRMESPPEEEEFLTPDDDSLSALSSQEPILALDLANDPTVLDEFVVVKRKADKVFDKMPEKKNRVLSIVDGSEGYSVGDQVFDEMLTRDKEVKMDIRGNSSNSIGVVGFEEDCEFGAKKDGSKMDLGEDMSTQVVDLDDEEMCRNEGAGRGDENITTQVVDLDDEEICNNEEAGRGDENITTQLVDLDDEEMCRNEGAGRGDENITTQVVDLDDEEICNNEEAGRGDENITTQLVDLDDEEMCRNEGAGRGDENITTQVVDFDGNGTFGDLSMRNVDVEMGKFTSADVDLDEDELYGDLTTRNLVDKSGPKEGDEVSGNEISGFSDNGIAKIDNGKCASLTDDENCQKDIGNSELYDDLSQREKEIDNALNIGSSEIEEIDKPVENNEGISVGGSSKPCCNKPSSDVIRGFFRKQANTSKGDNNQQKGKSQARKLPSTLDMLVKTAVSGSNVTHIESNKGAVGKNRCENEISKPVGGETTNDQIMKNLLDGLDLIIGEKEKVDDGSNEEVDILETAIRMGLKFPRPRWWPEEGFDDD